MPAARVLEMRTPFSVRNPPPGAADAAITALLGTMQYSQYSNTATQVTK